MSAENDADEVSAGGREEVDAVLVIEAVLDCLSAIRLYGFPSLADRYLLCTLSGRAGLRTGSGREAGDGRV